MKDMLQSNKILTKKIVCGFVALSVVKKFYIWSVQEKNLISFDLEKKSDRERLGWKQLISRPLGKFYHERVY